MPGRDQGGEVDVSVVIVSWNVRDLLLRCLASVYRQLGPDLSAEVFVVDNASADGTVDAVAAAYPLVRLLANAENAGFVRANNQALCLARGRLVLLLNPDTEVRDGALASLVAAADAEPGIGAVGPKLLFSDGAVQSSRRRFPTLATAVVESTVLQRWFGSTGLLRRFYVADRSDDEEQDVDWLVGACLLAKAEALKQVGLLDERFFMYSEEVDLCYRLRRAGWRVRYLPKAEVLHYEARSSEQVPVTRHFFFHDSRCRYFAKHHGSAAGAALRLAVLLNYGYLSLEEGAKLLLGHKPTLRRQRLATYREVLRRHVRALFGGAP
ncbi:MAG: glycosyltransferase family 2 protein [Chloroflexota bacterium]